MMKVMGIAELLALRYESAPQQSTHESYRFLISKKDGTEISAVL